MRPKNSKVADPQSLSIGQLTAHADSQSIIEEALTAVREHFGMPVAYLSEFVDEKSVFRSVSAPGLEALIKPGDEMLLSDVYCPGILAGDIPQLIPDTADVEACQGLAITHSVPIRSHISLPVRRSDGTPYGMFCCLSPDPSPSLNPRDLSVMATYAALVARQIQLVEDSRSEETGRQNEILSILEDDALHLVFQPLVDLSTAKTVGYEALCRFDRKPYRAPDLWLKQAHEVGLSHAVETRIFEKVFASLPEIPETSYLSFNASPDLICSSVVTSILKSQDCSRLVVEVNEAQDVQDSATLSNELEAIRRHGCKIALDDVGAGFSGLSRIAETSPDILKVDRSIAQSIDSSAPKRAVVASLVHLAREMEAMVLVEGIERPEEAQTLHALGVDCGQGWLFGRPKPLNLIVAGQD